MTNKCDGHPRSLRYPATGRPSLQVHSSFSESSLRFAMRTFPKRPNETVAGMMWFPRMLDKIRLHVRGELHSDYQPNLGRTVAMDGRCLNFLRVKFEDL